jgi:hypothetical protein
MFERPSPLEGKRRESAMKRAVRLAVIAGMALAFVGTPMTAIAQEADDGAKTAEVAKPSDPCTDIEPGAASPEPPQALEDPASVEESNAHKAWLEEIWTSP